MTNLDAAALLLDRGASVHIVTDSGRAPLYQAAYVRIIVSFSLVFGTTNGGSAPGPGTIHTYYVLHNVYVLISKKSLCIQICMYKTFMYMYITPASGTGPSARAASAEGLLAY